MNCIIIDDDPIVQRQLETFIIKSDLLDLKGTFKNPIDATETINAGNIDIVFLDIEMPEMSGLEFLDESDSEIEVIVISGDRKYALDTFEYNVTDYLLKPIEFNRFMKSVSRAVERNLEKADTPKNGKIYFKTNNHFVRLKFDDIVVIKNECGKKLIITPKKSFTVLGNLFDNEIICGLKNFFKINDSFIVNLNEINEVCDNFLIFKESENIENMLVEKSVADQISERINKMH